MLPNSISAAQIGTFIPAGTRTQISTTAATSRLRLLWNQLVIYSRRAWTHTLVSAVGLDG